MSDTIRRAQHGKENPYFIMSRATAQDKVLSYEARGLLAYLLSKPGDWQVRVEDLILPTPDGGTTKAGKSKVYAILDELAQHSYVEKPKRYRDDKGQWLWTAYQVHERPYTDLPDMGKPYTGAPDTGQPDTANRDSLENTESHTTDEQNTEEEEESSDTQNASSAAARIGEIASAYEQNIGLVTANVRELLLDAAATYPAEWILDAFKEATKYNKRSWAYCESILSRWARDGHGASTHTQAAPTPLPPQQIPTIPSLPER